MAVRVASPLLAVVIATLAVTASLAFARKSHHHHDHHTPAGDDAAAATTTATDNFGPIHRLPLDPSECASLVVMLHGLGDSGDGWLGTMGSYQMARPSSCVLLPTARRMHVQVAKKAVNAWFDVSDARFRDLKQESDVEQVKASAEYVLRVVLRQMRKFDIPWRRVAFAGFSQGGALALYAALTAPETTGGVVVVGGFLCAQSHLLGLGVMNLLRRDTPVLFIHGEADKVVPIAHARHAVESLTKVGLRRVEIKTDPKLDHGLNDNMFRVFADFLDEKTAPGDDDL